MKKILIIACAVCAVSGLSTSCDDYIDITPTGAITVDSASQYLDLMGYPQRTYYSTAYALLSDNSWIREASVFGYENRSFDGINFTFNEEADRLLLSDNGLYENCYKFILRSNIVLSEVDNSIGSDDTKQLAKAEARIFRAWDHFVAVNTFAKAYNPETAQTDGGVPIVGEYNLEKDPVKSTVAQVYDFILKEVDEAAPQLEVTPKNAYHPSKAFGYALKALVHLFHRDWDVALEAADQSLALNSQLIDLVELWDRDPDAAWKSNTEYGNSGNPEVLNYAGVGNVGTAENMLYTYGMISPELVQLYGGAESQDARFRLFFKTTGNSKSLFDDGSGAALWNSRATKARFYYTPVGLRTAEVYLMKAECQARLGDVSGAMLTLNNLREKRIKGFNASQYTASNTQEMMEQIINERRKELFNGFHRFWDLKRLNTEPEYQKTIVRTFPLVNISDEHPQRTYTLRPDSRLYIIPFPEAVRSMNSNITLNTDE